MQWWTLWPAPKCTQLQLQHPAQSTKGLLASSLSIQGSMEPKTCSIGELLREDPQVSGSSRCQRPTLHHVLAAASTVESPPGLHCSPQADLCPATAVGLLRRPPFPRPAQHVRWLQTWSWVRPALRLGAFAITLCLLICRTWPHVFIGASTRPQLELRCWSLSH